MGSISRGVRFRILLRDDFTCQYCGVKAPEGHLEIDHIVARSLGGHDGAANLVTACFNCNRGKRDAVLGMELVDRFSKREANEALPVGRPKPVRRVHISPAVTFTEAEPTYRVCSGCGNRRYYEGDDLCSCRSRFEKERICDVCTEVMDDDDDEICRSCYNRLYVYCEDCEEEDREHDSDYCAECRPKHPEPKRFLGGVSV